MTDFPPVPLTLEGSSVLHQFFRFDWKAWRSCADGERKKIATDAIAALSKLERSAPDAPLRTALFSQLGHKGDLMLIHFRDSLEALNQVELALAQTALYDFLELRHSYVSVVELGLYESSRKTYEAAAAKGFEPALARISGGSCRHSGARLRGHGSAPLPRRSRSQIPLLLSHGPQA